MPFTASIPEYSSTREVHLIRSVKTLTSNVSTPSKTEVDTIIAEEPLEIFIQPLNSEIPPKALATTMRTPGHDSQLAIGYLYSEGIIKHREDILSIYRPKTSNCADPTPSNNQIVVQLNTKTLPDNSMHSRLGLQSSSCGLCGQTSIEHILQTQYPNRYSTNRVWTAEDLTKSLKTIETHQPLFHETGGSHGAWLIDSQHQVTAFYEDIGRHNALDKTLGYTFTNPKIKPADLTLIMSSRLSYELVHKAAILGVNLIASVGAPSSLAIELAKKLNITTLGFLKATQFNIYTNPRFYFQF